jgi:hypothetical protein
MRPFFILGLPRSRTAWLANFLCYGPAFCFHEALIGCDSIKSYARRLCAVDAEHVGDSSSGTVFFIDDIMHLFPEARLVVVERNQDECKVSMTETGFPADAVIDDTLAMLEYTKTAYKPMVIAFDALTKNGCEDIWDHCIGGHKDTRFYRRLELLDGLHIEVVMAKKVAEITDNMHHFEALMRANPCQCSG